jgi:hypothetical protein
MAIHKERKDKLVVRVIGCDMQESDKWYGGLPGVEVVGRDR